MTSPTTTRRAAREQALPDSEAETLKSLSGTALYQYIANLYAAGWTLRAIGEVFDPPRSRSTIRSWIQKLGSAPAVDPTQVETPTLKTPEFYIPKKAASPGISASDARLIDDLAPVARKYRAGMHPLHRASTANQDLTELVTRLHESGVSVQELATAAGVTYRAMARRLGKTS